jgi:putative transposase
VITDQESSPWKQKIENVLMVTPCYGYRKVTHALKRTGEIVNHKKIMRIMRETGLKQKKRRFKPRTTDSRHSLRVFPNFIKEIIPLYPNHIWVTDITYVRLPDGFCYVAIVLDVYTRKVAGWSIALHMEKELVIEALERALRVGTPTYHHSDRGGQYCATEYVNRLEGVGAKISMADTGVSVDNPFAESFNKTLKVEEVYLKNYQNLEEARASIDAFITDVYHTKRLHQSLNYQTPEEFSTRWNLQNPVTRVHSTH